jgi:hypothetical protein
MAAFGGGLPIIPKGLQPNLLPIVYDLEVNNMDESTITASHLVAFHDRLNPFPVLNFLISRHKSKPTNISSNIQRPG